MVERFINIILNKLGYEIWKKGSKRGFSLYCPEYLGQITQPKTVVDVGVAYGTPALYEAFPSAYFILIEPVEEYENDINRILSLYKGEVHYKAVSNEKGSLEINVNKANLLLSSLLDRAKLTRRKTHIIEKRNVDVTTLDDLLTHRSDLERPLLLKIDTEGNELNVLNGAGELLKQTDFVIAEVNIAERFENSYSYEELLTFMNSNGFYLFSILSVAHSPSENRPRFADIIFAKCTDQPRA